MDFESDDFYVSLSSKAKSSTFPNTPFNFKISYPQDIKLVDGNWKVALTRLLYKRTWKNFTEKDMGKLVLFHISEHGYEKIHENGGGLIKSTGEVLHRIYKNTEWDPAKSKYVYNQINFTNGYYETPGEIVAQLVRDFKHVKLSYLSPQEQKVTKFNSELPLYYQYEKNEKTIKLDGPVAFLFVNANHIISALGIKNNFSPIDEDINHKLVTGGLLGRNGKIPGVIDTMYLYSDLFEVNSVGDEKANFVTVVPVEGEHGSSCHYAPAKPEYKKVRHNTIKSIELQISDCYGDDIKFDKNSESIAMFHFKRSERLD